MRKIYSFITLGIIISVYYIFYYSTYPNDSWIHEINLGPHFILIPMLLLILASTGKKGFTISLIVGIIFSIIVSQNRIYIDDKGVHKRNMKTFQTSTIGWKELERVELDTWKARKGYIYVTEMTFYTKQNDEFKIKIPENKLKKVINKIKKEKVKLILRDIERYEMENLYKGFKNPKTIRDLMIIYDLKWNNESDQIKKIIINKEKNKKELIKKEDVELIKVIMHPIKWTYNKDFKIKESGNYTMILYYTFSIKEDLNVLEYKIWFKEDKKAIIYNEKRREYGEINGIYAESLHELFKQK